MPVCYFDNDYDHKYNCQYEIFDSTIKVDVEYDINDEIEPVNGVRIFSDETSFKSRDILIIDYKNRTNYLAKNAFYIKNSVTYGTPDSNLSTSFKSHVFFEHGSYRQLMELPQTPKAKKIRIHSKSINEIIGYPCLAIVDNGEEYAIKLDKNYQGKEAEIGVRNVKTIKIKSCFKSNFHIKNGNLNVEFTGYLEVSLRKRDNYDLIYEYIKEMQLYLQLYYPDKVAIDKLEVLIDENWYGLYIFDPSIKISSKNVRISVEEDLLKFLDKCYRVLPYRKGKSEFRNIPFIVQHTSRNIEDNFLMFYRFIECYYKKRKIPDISNTFISYSINKHFVKNHHMSDEEKERYSNEIVCLRNHYVHSGYYLKNNSLKISSKSRKGKESIKGYTVNNANIEWIFKRTEILYEIAIDIIFNEMLGYENYLFKRHF